MARIISAPLLLVLYLAVAQAGWRELKEWFCNARGNTLCKVEVELMDPAGLRVWTPYKPEIKLFGIELYINPTGKNDICSVCKNTTETVHGKFIVQDNSVIVKKGDFLEYVAITGCGRKITRHKPKKIYVDDYVIQSKNGCGCSTPALHATRIANSNSEIDLLERVVFSLSNSCSEGIPSNYLFLQENPVSGSASPLQRLKTYFKDNPMLNPYTKSITTAENGNGGITFQVSTIIDKLKILELSPVDGKILDYDKVYDTEEINVRLPQASDNTE